MARQYLIVPILTCAMIVTARRPAMSCKREPAYPNCMLDYRKRALWCDMSNYVSLNEIRMRRAHLGDIAALYLNYSCLQRIHPEKKMKEFPGLTRLYLDNNFIKEIPERIFIGNNKLQQVDLSTNNISTIRKSAFKGLRNLQVLTMDKNGVTHLTADWLQDLQSLRSLSMRKNKLKEIKRNQLDSLQLLTSLNLKENRIKFIAGLAFYGLSKLQELHLDGNQLTNIYEGAFDGLNNLRILSLSSNRISKWSKFRFPLLYHIDLSFNGLVVVSEDAFDSLCKLQYVDLRNNILSGVSAQWIRGRGNRNFSIDLNGNSLECRCAAADFQRELQNAPNVNVMGLICQTPRYTRNRSLLDGDLVDEIRFRANCEATSDKARSKSKACLLIKEDLSSLDYIAHIPSNHEIVSESRPTTKMPSTKLSKLSGMVDDSRYFEVVSTTSRSFNTRISSYYQVTFFALTAFVGVAIYS